MPQLQKLVEASTWQELKPLTDVAQPEIRGLVPVQGTCHFRGVLWNAGRNASSIWWSGRVGHTWILSILEEDVLIEAREVLCWEAGTSSTCMIATNTRHC